eukprot:403994-Pelagomonas_calceolata.AAC.4
MEAKAQDPRPALKQLPAETPGGPEKRQKTVPVTPLAAAVRTPSQTALPFTPAPGRCASEQKVIFSFIHSFAAQPTSEWRAPGLLERKRRQGELLSLSLSLEWNA